MRSGSGSDGSREAGGRLSKGREEERRLVGREESEGLDHSAFIHLP